MNDLPSLERRIEKLESHQPDVMQYQLTKLEKSVQTLTRAAITLTVTVLGSVVALFLTNSLT